jgi:predicted Zn-dependent protease
MIRDLSVAIVSIWLFNHAIDFLESLETKPQKKEIHENVEYTAKSNPVKKVNYETFQEYETDTENFDFEKVKEIEDERAKRLITVRALGSENKEALRIAANSISSFFGFDVSVIDYPMAITDGMFERDSLNADKVLNAIEADQFKTIYITKLPMTVNQGCEVLGYTSYGGTVVVITSKEGIDHTSLHELCHTYGLKHCNDKNCLMYKAYLGTKKDLCEHCVAKLQKVLPDFRKKN